MSTYDDIIDLPHFHDSSRPYMTMHDRAAQFAPYKSLTGYDEMLTATAEDILAADIRPATADTNSDFSADPTSVSGT